MTTEEAKQDIKIVEDAVNTEWLRAWTPGLIDATKNVIELAKKSMVIVCAFCGKETVRSDDVPLDMATHIAECDKHPMRAAVEENIKLRELVAAQFAWQAEFVNELMPDELAALVKDAIGPKRVEEILDS